MQFRLNSIFVAEKVFFVKLAFFGVNRNITLTRDSLSCFKANKTLLRTELKPNN